MPNIPPITVKTIFFKLVCFSLSDTRKPDAWKIHQFVYSKPYRVFFASTNGRFDLKLYFSKHATLLILFEKELTIPTVFTKRNAGIYSVNII